MNIDSKIKRELEDEALEIDRILAKQDEGLFTMLGNTFRSNMKVWVILINIVILLLTVGMFYTGYHFFTTSGEPQIYWGFITLAILQVQVATKQWVFNEMNRNSLTREIKRLELAIAELAVRQES